MATFKNIDNERATAVKAFNKETDVINPLVAYSDCNKLGLKIFPGVDITKAKLGLISLVVTGKFKFKQEKEIDAVVIGKSAIYLVETKSSCHGVFVSLIKSIEVAELPAAK